MAGRFARSLALAKASWSVIQADKELLWLPVLAYFVALVALVVLSALQATMQGIYSAALYRYATEPGQPFAGFTPELMEVAFKAKG